MQTPVSILSTGPARAIPSGESRDATQHRLLALIDEARAAVLSDPALTNATVKKFQAPLHAVLRVGFVLIASANKPNTAMFMQAREGRS